MIKADKFRSTFAALSQLTKRNVKLFFKDKMNVFFSFFAAIIILVLYVLFLGRVQTEGIQSSIPEGFTVADSAIKAFVDGWMLAGVMGVSCLTVALSAMNTMVSDKANKIINDFFAAPINKSIVMLSYFFAAFFTTVMIAFAILFVGLAYLAAAGSFFLTVGGVFELAGITLLSALSAVMLMIFLAGFIKTEAALGAFSGVISAMIGFVIGAYMPPSTFPKAVQYLSCFIPGSYSAGLFRNVFMQGALNNFTAGMPSEFADSMAEAYSFKLDLFGLELGKGAMYALLAASIFIFLAVNLLKYRFTKKAKG